MEREIQQALTDAGDHAGAFLWRRLCRDLDGALRVAVAAADASLADRIVKGRGAEWVFLQPASLDVESDPVIGAQDRLLGCHGLVVPTPYASALGTGEREMLERLVELGAPTQRAVVLSGRHLLERMSDDPDGEAADVRSRVQLLMPEDWTLLDERELEGWLSSSRADVHPIARRRRAAVGRLLLDDSRTRADSTVSRAEAELAAVDALLAAEEEVLDTARRAGERAAGHMLAAVRRQTEELLVDLRAFLVDLERDLDPQVRAVEDLDHVRRHLAHWLDDVVEGFIADRVAQWRAAVLAELAEVEIEENDAARAELLVPALHPPPVRPEPDWPTRIGVTAAVGGGAALLAFGMWVPGVVAMGSGLAWSAIGQRARAAKTREQLVEAATEALRRMGQEAERVLSDQIAQLREELGRLGEYRAQAAADDRADRRAELDHQRAQRSRRLDDVTELRSTLNRHLEQLAPVIGATG